MQFKPIQRGQGRSLKRGREEADWCAVEVVGTARTERAERSGNGTKDRVESVEASSWSIESLIGL